MKKKILTFVLAICFLLPCAFVFSACGHTHAYDENVLINTDAEGHYHICDDCGKMIESEKVAHTFSSDCDTTCNDCGYERTTSANHNFGSYTIINASTQHFHTCIACGIEERGDCNNDCFEKCSYCMRAEKSHSYADGICACGDIQGLQYAYNSKGYYQISGYTGSLSSFTIPQRYNDGTHGTLPISAIDLMASSSNTTITSITIPKSITSISAGAFKQCKNLEQLIVQSDNTKYYSENNCIIETATKTLIAGCKNSVVPDGVTSIGKDAFHDCLGLTNVVLPSTVTIIQERAFWGCTSLSQITLPNVTNISFSVFYNCKSLTNITLPNTLSTIGDNAFYGCANLTGIKIPDSVYSLGSSAFDHCSNLEFAILGSGIEEIKALTFSNCSKLKYIVIGSSNSSATKVKINAFQKCSALEKVYTSWSNENDIAIFKNNVSSNNVKLTDATFYLYKNDAPTSNGSYQYWHYDDNGDIAIWPLV